MRRLLLMALLMVSGTAMAEDGFVPMFNGKDLSGWVNVNGHPSTFFVKDGMIITNGKPTGFLRTEKQYENFILEMEWMHMNKTAVGNSGLFVWGDPLPAVGTPYTRGIEVQVLVNLNVKDTYTSHGDLFSIWGAKCKPDRPHPKGWERCLPSENRCKGGGEWNHYRVEANNGVIKLHVNGKEVSGVSESNPRKGYLALESEGAECRYKNIKIKELPSTNPKPNEIADVAKGHKLIYNGLDFDGLNVGLKSSWKANEGSLSATMPTDSDPITTKASFTNPELIADFRFPAKSETNIAMFTVGGKEGLHVIVSKLGQLTVGLGQGKIVTLAKVEPFKVKADGWNRIIVNTADNKLTLTVNGTTVVKEAVIENFTAKGTIGMGANGPINLMHPYVREVKAGQ